MPTKLDNASFILRSNTRRKIFELLTKPKTPTQLSKEANLNIGFVSNILIGLLKRKLIECLTPNEKRYRLYKITKEGEKLIKVIKELENSNKKD